MVLVLVVVVDVLQCVCVCVDVNRYINGKKTSGSSSNGQLAVRDLLQLYSSRRSRAVRLAAACVVIFFPSASIPLAHAYAAPFSAPCNWAPLFGRPSAL